MLELVALAVARYQFMLSIWNVGAAPGPSWWIMAYNSCIAAVFGLPFIP